MKPRTRIRFAAAGLAAALAATVTIATVTADASPTAAPTSASQCDHTEYVGGQDIYLEHQSDDKTEYSSTTDGDDDLYATTITDAVKIGYLREFHSYAGRCAGYQWSVLIVMQKADYTGASPGFTITIADGTARPRATVNWQLQTGWSSEIRSTAWVLPLGEQTSPLIKSGSTAVTLEPSNGLYFTNSAHDQLEPAWTVGS